MLEQVRKEAHAAAQQICEAAKLRQGQILVVGCSTSEVTGHKVGSYSSPELGQAIYEGMQEVLIPRGIYLAAQCCEHLNRALVVDQKAMEKFGWQQVTVRPIEHAGGAFAATAYNELKNPVVVEKIQADMGLDIGQTLIGMHLKRVAVPVRLSRKKLGNAVLTAARTRPPLIGGERAVYK